MPYTAEHKQETRQRILKSARRLFNKKGFSSVTIDEIMNDAGLTRGGFYRHFNAKEDLYADAVRQFLCKIDPEPWQSKHVDGCAEGQTLARMVVNAYFSRDHFDDREGSCPVIGLPSDVSRSGKTVKAAYREVVQMMLGIFQENLGGPRARERSLVLVALCVGGMVLARSVDDPDLGDDFRSAARKHVLRTAGWRDGRRE
jgi:TetR/AcrR family transcriptional repressor of nem operon